ncbi:hypothetical protein GGR53DRAFT_465067 [Hypoxylon sp. FL1150]|nr:hypothetical protein GGR53DRAFT_465067 [Hypoxylon sp. FL1150]
MSGEEDLSEVKDISIRMADFGLVWNASYGTDLAADASGLEVMLGAEWDHKAFGTWDLLYVGNVGLHITKSEIVDWELSYLSQVWQLAHGQPCIDIGGTPYSSESHLALIELKLKLGQCSDSLIKRSKRRRKFVNPRDHRLSYKQNPRISLKGPSSSNIIDGQELDDFIDFI